MRIETTSDTRGTLKLQSSKKFVKRIVNFGIGLLEKYFGAKILLEVPPNLQEINPELYQAIDVAHKLKSVGIISELRKIPKFADEPHLFRFVASPGINRGSGADFLSEKKAVWKTLGETAERYLWSTSDAFYCDRLVKKPYSEIKKSALNILGLAGFSNEQRKKIGFLKFDEKTNFRWIEADSLISGKKKFCPVQLVSLRYFRENVKTFEHEEGKEPMLRWIITTGLATGQSLEEAVVKGILEVIERDAFMISWLNRISPPRIDLENLVEQDEDLKRIVRYIQRYHLELHLLQLPTDFAVHIYAAIIVDHSGLGPAFSIGASSDFDLKICLVDAISESLSVRLSLKNKLNADEESQKKMNRRGRLVFWSVKENLPKIEFFFRGNKKNLDLEKDRSVYSLDNELAERKKYYEKKLMNLRDELRKKSCETCYVELTTPEIKDLGFRCAKVVIPELQPMHLDESIPYFGGKRLKEVPERRGYMPAEELNKEPHPFP